MGAVQSRGSGGEAVARPVGPDAHRPLRSVTVAGLLLGVGLGGFVDGIVLHQVLQWHHLVSNTDAHPPSTLAGLEANTLGDGLFHAATWVATVAGAWLLLRVARRAPDAWRSRSTLGLALAGWGVFNLVEGAVDHHVLRIHHVREGVENRWAYDLGFLALGAVLLAAGWVLDRRARAASALR